MLDQRHVRNPFAQRGEEPAGALDENHVRLVRQFVGALANHFQIDRSILLASGKVR